MELGFQADDLCEAQNIFQKCYDEFRKLWRLATPIIICTVAQFSISLVTVAFAGHLGSSELAAVSIIQNVVEGFVYGLMLGIGSALETICGQAVGAGQLDMLGVYLQRSCLITLVTALLLTPFYIYTSSILQILHQDKGLSEVAGKYAIWVIPQLYAYALNFPVQKFLQAQGRIWIMTLINVGILPIHGVLNWVLVIKFQHGLLGTAIAENISWWLLVFAQIFYVVSGFFPKSWTGFSMLAFKGLWTFVRLSVTSAVMICLEVWYFTIGILMVGWLRYPEIAVDAMSINMYLQDWVLMISLGFNAAISVRISNELGAGCSRAAKFSMIVAVVTSTFIGALFAFGVIASMKYYPLLLSSNPDVIRKTQKLAYFLAATICLMSCQTIFHGVAVGAGSQHSVAIINIVCYFVIGLPVSACLGYVAHVGVEGIWSGMLCGALLQTLLLLLKMRRANWQKEAIRAAHRLRALTSIPVEDEIEHQIA